MTKDINNFREQFFIFEKENLLYEIKDGNNFPLWDIIRPTVFAQIISSGCDIPSMQNYTPVSKMVRLRQIVRFVSYFLLTWRRKYLFFLCSRNYDGKEYFDRIGDSSIKQFKKQNIYIVESFGTEIKEGYRYGRATAPMVGFARRFLRNNYDFSHIADLVRRKFPECQINVEEWMSSYRYFYAQFYYYSLLFRLKGIEKCFIVQNQYQKGLFAAAKKNKIPVIEFQHGEMTTNHLAYSYPVGIELNGKIHVPTHLLTFGNFWMKDCNMPGVVIKVVGNDFYHINRDELANQYRDILVVSSNIHGEHLSQLVLKVLSSSPEEKIKFYFKLHPNEYEMYNKYVNLFKDYDNVEVISGTQMVSDLLKKVAFIVCIESTVEFEALSAGVKVMIYKRGDYQYISSLFEEDGVYLIDNEDDLINIYKENKNKEIKNYSDYYFSSFNPEIIKEIIATDNSTLV